MEKKSKTLANNIILSKNAIILFFKLDFKALSLFLDLIQIFFFYKKKFTSLKLLYIS